jgi:hypothetical protein
MLAAIKDLLRGVVPFGLYLGIFLIAALGAIKRVRWSFTLLVVLVALPNLWYKVHEYPFGHATFDVLFFACALGIVVNGGGYDRAPRRTLILGAILVAYIALWNTSLRFNLPAPLTLNNSVLADYKNYAEMLALYFLAYNIPKNEEHQRQLTLVMIGVILFICVHEIRNFSTGASYDEDKRAMGPFWIVGLGPNHFGAFIAHFGAVIVGLLLVDKDRRRRWFYLVAAYCLVYPLFSSYSRGAYLGALAALFVIGAVRSRLLLIGAVALVLSWQFVLPATVVERVSMTEDSSGQIEDSAATRLLLWSKAKELFVANPVFGIGFNGFSVSVRFAGLNNVHNYYMQLAAEEGVIGLALMAAILLRSFGSGWRLYRIGITPFSKGLGLGFMGCVTAAAVTNIFGDRWSYLNMGAFFWVFWGLVDRAATNALVTEEVRGPDEKPAPAKPLLVPQRA